MSVSFAELKPVFDVLRATYKNRDTLTMLLAFGGPGRALDDYVGPNDSMPSVYLKVVSAAANQGWLSALMDAVLEDTTLTEDRRGEIRADWSGLLRRLDPEPGFAHWEHLRTDGVAFVNRTTLRATVSAMLNVLGPRVLVLKGDPLSGTSYTWRLISHIARSDATTQCTFFDFATWKGDPRPLGVMEAIAAHLALDATPRRADMPSDDHLAAFLVTWLVGQLQQLEGMRWLVFDNAHATVLPQATKEMIAGLADALSRGTVDNARMFVLGFDLALIGHSNARALELRLTRLGQPDFEEYLTTVEQRFGGLGGEFANPTEVLDEVFSDVSIDAADRLTLEAISAQLDRIVQAAQEAGAPAPGAQ
ncbi:MAG: effector-associated domain EAD1-containing protein [Pseudomonadota bacterium]